MCTFCVNAGPEQAGAAAVIRAVAPEPSAAAKSSQLSQAAEQKLLSFFSLQDTLTREETAAFASVVRLVLFKHSPDSGILVLQNATDRLQPTVHTRHILLFCILK